MRSLHRMPFGAEYTGSGTRFSLWAPGAEEVSVYIDGQGKHRMRRSGAGFHVFEADTVGPGARYGFICDADSRQLPDPASRFNPTDVHGLSEVVDPLEFEWQDGGWIGSPWNQPVFYELHVGSFSPSGTYAGVENMLAHLVDLGVDAIELMPIAQFPGRRNWGYDGALPFAPAAAYGRPEDLKRLVQAAHRHGLMIFLDVVYNHFGPEGNYLGAYAPQFFTDRHVTPWGAAINFDGPDSDPVRHFFIHNALYWLEEFHFDGLRLDAVHAILDDSSPGFLEDLAVAVERLQRETGRKRHLVLENGDNGAHHLRRDDTVLAPGSYAAQWNDDFHHSTHVLLTGENAGYYEDYDRPAHRLLRCLTEGFAYQGEPSRHWEGKPRGEPSVDLPPNAFVNFLQNHDQVGNRAHGERLWMLCDAKAIRAAETMLLLLPTPILLFMGDEFHAPSPFPFFAEFSGDLARAVTEGRRNEFAHFFTSARDIASIPDPNEASTAASARLDWEAAKSGRHASTLARYRDLLGLRAKLLQHGAPLVQARGRTLGSGALTACWKLADGATLSLLTNLSDEPIRLHEAPAGRLLVETQPYGTEGGSPLPDWYTAWYLDAPSPSLRASKPGNLA